MVYDPGALHVALAAAVGDDPQLVAELRGAFLDSAATLVDQLKRSRCDANWRMAALRLQGLGGSFGAVALMSAAEAAVNGAPGDPVALREIEQAIAAFDC
jgi:HPt (histidine-containing phosphotransfer) domain-containing protein